jgi:XapX domain-containing protein
MDSRKEDDAMKLYLFSFGVGCVVGLIYGAVRLKSPAPPLVALIGLLGMLIGEGGYAWLRAMIR